MPVSQVETLERGIRGTTRTVEKMHKLVALGKLDLTMQKIATWIRLTVPEDFRGNSKKVLDALFKFFREHSVFLRDPFQIEKIEHPIESMRPVIEARRAGAYKGRGLFVGDCDTIAGTMLATLGGILGFHYSWETARVDPGRPDEFSHIWTSFLLKGNEWYPLDPSTPGAYPGWRPPVSGDRFKRWPEKPIEDVIGMSGMNGHGLGYDPSGPMIPGDLFDAEMSSRYYQGPSDIPRIQGDDFTVHIPPDSAISRADMMEGSRSGIRKMPTPKPQERPMQIEPNDDYRPSPNYEARRDYISVTPYGGASPQYPFTNQVEVLPGAPITIRRRGQEVVLRAQMEQGMSGMGAEESQFVFTMEDANKAAATTAAKETTSTIDSIINGIAKTLPGLAVSAIDAMKAKYAAQVSGAQAKVLAQSQAGMGPQAPYSSSTPLYKNPLVWGAGILVIGGIAYAIAQS